MSDQLFISKLKFRGANLLAIREKESHETILCSPADTGKTMALSYKTIIIANQIPRCHIALVRKTFSSIQDSVVKTYDRLIAGLGIRKLGGTRIDKYIFPNESEVVLIGCDRPDKLLSSEWDAIQVTQAEELSAQEWEVAASRVTGRGAVFKHPAIYGCCNPSSSNHWIRKRKSLKLIVGSQKDNPELYDDAGNLTPEGKRRMDLADKMLTGVRRQRLLYGNWATAEGAVYDTFSTQVHVIERQMSEMKEILLSVDEGYTNPAVILAIGEDSDGRMHVFREFYKTGQLQETVVREIKSWSDEFGGCQIYVDEAAAGLIADLKALGLRVQGAKGRTPDSSGKHIIKEGIQAVQNRLKVQDDGRPRLTFDPNCVNTINEMESYHWKEGTDDPEKELDHSADAMRYAIAARMNKTGFDSADGFRVGGNAGIVDLSDNLIFVPERLELDQF